MKLRQWTKLCLCIVSFVSMLQVCRASLFSDVGLQNGADTKAEIVRHLRPVLRESKAAARIYYRAPCDNHGFDTNAVQHLPFPKLATHSPLSFHEPLAAAQEIFRGNKDVAIKEGSTGALIIEIGTIADSLLSARISSIKFAREERYDADLAVDAILHSKDMVSAMERLRVKPVVTFEDRVTGYPSDDAPHLTGAMKNVTFDEALSTIASTFGGIVMYGTCNRPRLFDIEYFSVEE